MLSSPCCVYILQSIPPCLIVISLCNRCVNLQLLRQSYVVPRQAYKILFLLPPLLFFSAIHVRLQTTYRRTDNSKRVGHASSHKVQKSSGNRLNQKKLRFTRLPGSLPS